MSHMLSTKDFGDPDLSDVKLVVGDTVFNVHRMILAFRSKYFKALFYGDFEEKNKDRIDIHDVDVLAFEIMIEEAYNWCFSDIKFLTCGESGENTSKAFWEEATNLWAVLDRFDCPKAREYMQGLLMKNWCNPSNGTYHCGFCINRFAFAKIHGIPFKENEFNHQAIKKWTKCHFDGVPDVIYSSGLLREILMNIADR